jgi:fructose-1,6-bisphosphatase II
VITAAAMRCLNGYMVGRLTGYTDEQKERMKEYGITDVHKTYTAEELAPGENIIFAATGVTDGSLMQGVRFFGEGVRTSSVIMKMASRKVRFVEGIHIEQGKEFQVRF